MHAVDVVERPPGREASVEDGGFGRANHVLVQRRLACVPCKEKWAEHNFSKILSRPLHVLNWYDTPNWGSQAVDSREQYNSDFQPTEIERGEHPKPISH